MYLFILGVSQVTLSVKKQPANAGDLRDAVQSLGCEDFPGRGHGHPLQYFCLENSTYRGAWRSTVHAVTKIWTWLMHSFQRVREALSQRRTSEQKERESQKVDELHSSVIDLGQDHQWRLTPFSGRLMGTGKHHPADNMAVEKAQKPFRERSSSLCAPDFHTLPLVLRNGGQWL